MSEMRLRPRRRGLGPQSRARARGYTKGRPKRASGETCGRCDCDAFASTAPSTPSKGGIRALRPPHTLLITATAAYNPATPSRSTTLGGYALFSGCSRILIPPSSKYTRLNVV